MRVPLWRDGTEGAAEEFPSALKTLGTAGFSGQIPASVRFLRRSSDSPNILPANFV
jgi:hypothetical protein